MVALTSYIIHVYVLLPIVWKGVQWVYDKRYDFCPVVKCIRPLSACLTDSECRLWLDAVAECQIEGSEARKRAEEAFDFVQHPPNPAYCQYQTFDQITNSVAIDFLECIGSSGCLPPSQFSDTCADMTNLPKVPMNEISNLKGRWYKVYTTGWDTWPCQWTDFWAPHSEEPEPEDWMTKWPSTPNVWRMDLYWKPEASANTTFHMNNEMYLDQTWDFTINEKKAPSSSATLKTRAVMWGTEAHENWYLLDYRPEWNTMLVYYCAYTAAVDAYDSMAMVLKRQDDDSDGDDPLSYSIDLSSEQQEYYKSKAMELLGEFHGNLQQIRTCQ